MYLVSFNFYNSLSGHDLRETTFTRELLQEKHLPASHAESYFLGKDGKRQKFVLPANASVFGKLKIKIPTAPLFSLYENSSDMLDM